MTPKASYRGRLDLLSMGASLLCAIHCVALPVFFSTLPLMGIELMENIWLELLTIAISMLAGGWAIWRAYRHHHGIVWMPVSFVAGVLLMVAGNFVQVEWVEMLTKALGAVVLVAVHIINWKKSVASGHQHHEEAGV